MVLEACFRNVPQAFYLDRGQHFFNDVLIGFLHSEGVAIDFSPSGTSKSTGMVEVCNKLLEEVLRKDSSQTGMEWDRRVPRGASNVNTRTIKHLGHSSKAILFCRTSFCESDDTCVRGESPPCDECKAGKRGIGRCVEIPPFPRARRSIRRQAAAGWSTSLSRK